MLILTIRMDMRSACIGPARHGWRVQWTNEIPIASKDQVIGIIEGLAAAKAGMELTKLARELLKRDKIDRDEVLSRVNEIQDHLIDAREALSDALEEKRELKHTVEDLEERLRVRASVIPADEAYFTRKDDGMFDGPFCTVCWDNEEKLVRMKFLSEREHAGKGLLKSYACLIHTSNSIKLAASAFLNNKI